MAVPTRLKLAAALVNGAAGIATLLAIALLLPVVPAPAIDAGDQAARLALWARLAVFPAALILVLVVATSAARAMGEAYDPIADPEPRGYRVAQRVLTNTVEQTAAFLPALAALAVVVPEARLGAPGLLTALFVAGRLAFAAGYAIHPYARAPGMSTTATVTLVTFVWAIARVLFPVS
ncbi:MAG: MAPEG family protein [Azospirillaceae bacterium]